MKKILSILLICFSFSATAQNTAPNFMVTDISGETHDLYEYLGQGKYVVVNFMGTWCGPCQGVAEDYGLGFLAFGCNNIDVIFIDIDTGSDTQACIDFNEEYMTGIQGLPMVSGTDGGGDAAHNTYGITGVPSIITISPLDSTYTETHLGFYTNLAQEGIEPVSPTEYCQFDYTINGCTDQNAINYNLSANADNGSCEYSSVIYDSLNSNIGDALLSLSSLQQALDTWNTTIDLSAGWNMFGYGCPSPIDVAEGLSNHTESIAIVKDNNGSVYMPEFSFNGIGAFTPGFGYQIKVIEAIEGFSLCDWYVNDIPEDNIVSLQEEVVSLSEENTSLQELVDFLSTYGCIDETAFNYNPSANMDDGSCQFINCFYPPDTEFVSWLQENTEGVMNGNCMDINAASIVENDLYIGNTSIINLDGLQYFTNLWYLDIYDNDALTSIPDLSQLYLEMLIISSNDLLLSVPNVSNVSIYEISNNDALIIVPDLSEVIIDDLYIGNNNSLVCVEGYPQILIDLLPADYLASSLPPVCSNYEVGDFAEGGIIFYVDEVGQHGLVAALQDLGQFEWGCFSENVEGADYTSIGTGYQNTMDIVNQGCSTLNGGITAVQAALDAAINGYSDWYLPSKDELYEMYNTIGPSGPDGNIGGFNDWSAYWSSSEINSHIVWSLEFGNGAPADYPTKNSSYSVRPIRAFGNWTMGCLDETACNYNSDANMADGNCEYAELGYDCDGNITAQLGDIFEGGYLFYIDSTGQHGLVAALEDLEGTYLWGCYEIEIDGADGTTLGTGYQNTLDIVAECSETSIAASEALAYESEGYSDWYLPSRDELLELNNTIGFGGPEGNIGGLSYGYYWSSSEASNTSAWCPYSGGSTYHYKHNTHWVRVIRAF